MNTRRAAVAAVRALSQDIGIPQHLHEVGVKEADIPALAASAVLDACTPGNPREVTEESVEALFRRAF
jgi:lactaldehyde reductase